MTLTCTYMEALQERRNDGALHRHHPLVGMPALGTQSPLLHQMPSEQTGDAAENQTESLPSWRSQEFKWERNNSTSRCKVHQAVSAMK